MLMWRPFIFRIPLTTSLSDLHSASYYLAYGWLPVRQEFVRTTNLSGSDFSDILI
jgi:hypothetical protein